MGRSCDSCNKCILGEIFCKFISGYIVRNGHITLFIQQFFHLHYICPCIKKQFWVIAGQTHEFCAWRPCSVVLYHTQRLSYNLRTLTTKRTRKEFIFCAGSYCLFWSTFFYVCCVVASRKVLFLGIASYVS
jgi:hypothetical protein